MASSHPLSRSKIEVYRYDRFTGDPHCVVSRHHRTVITLRDSPNLRTVIFWVFVATERQSDRTWQAETAAFYRESGGQKIFCAVCVIGEFTLLRGLAKE